MEIIFPVLVQSSINSKPGSNVDSESDFQVKPVTPRLSSWIFVANVRVNIFRKTCQCLHHIPVIFHIACWRIVQSLQVQLKIVLVWRIWNSWYQANPHDLWKGQSSVENCPTISKLTLKSNKNSLFGQHTLNIQNVLMKEPGINWVQIL